MAKYLKDPENLSIKQEFKFEALNTNHSTQRLRLGRLQIQQEEHVKWSCVDHRRGPQTLEVHAVVIV